MSREEWRRVVDALWLMRTLSEEEGQARFGPTYRSIAYFEIRHTPPRAQDEARGARFGHARLSTARLHKQIAHSAACELQAQAGSSQEPPPGFGHPRG